MPSARVYLQHRSHSRWSREKNLAVSGRGPWPLGRGASVTVRALERRMVTVPRLRRVRIRPEPAGCAVIAVARCGQGVLFAQAQADTDDVRRRMARSVRWRLHGLC